MKEIIVRYSDNGYGNVSGEIVGDLVRCKECRHNTTLDDGRIICGWYREYVKPDDYCSYGERREP